MEGRTRLRPATASIIIAILAVLVLAVDQFTKHLALENLPYQEPVRVWGEFLQFYLTRNPGAAFSFGEGVTWVFTIILAAAAVFIVVLAITRVRSRRWAIVLGLLLGGILGNLTDRLIRDPGFLVGHVVDFINTPWMWLGMNPAIYNVADMFIVTMMIGVALLVFIGLRLDGTRERGAVTAAADEPTGDAAGDTPEQDASGDATSRAHED
ncbi:MULTISPECIES: signal peptidase II [Microbacterium]|uniref:signal peptidase II n=1 Tax=Microbacterium TaxID=33882 RepID=UPI0019B55461|nr:MULTISPECIES: signal peptidase II [Microbacterium]MBD3757297.1 signal peptidase II [Microbacterium sp.]MBZ6371217.1 signal peptidase II [Microbacterium hominis]